MSNTPRLLCKRSPVAVLSFGLSLQLNALKRFLKLQAMPSLQEAYALPNSPKHIATITNGMQKVQLSQTPIAHPTGQAWPQFVPQHSRLAQALPQHSMASHNIHEEDCWASARQPTVQQSVSTMAQAQQQQQQQGLTAHAANASDKTTDCSGMIQKSHVQRQHHSGSTALQAGSIAAHASRPEWSNVTSTGSTKWLWDRHDDMQPEGQRFKEEELAEQAAVQEQACKRHLAGYALLLIRTTLTSFEYEYWLACWQVAVNAVHGQVTTACCLWTSLSCEHFAHLPKCHQCDPQRKIPIIPSVTNLQIGAKQRQGHKSVTVMRVHTACEQWQHHASLHILSPGLFMLQQSGCCCEVPHALCLARPQLLHSLAHLQSFPTRQSWFVMRHTFATASGWNV